MPRLPGINELFAKGDFWPKNRLLCAIFSNEDLIECIGQLPSNCANEPVVLKIAHCPNFHRRGSV